MRSILFAGAAALALSLPAAAQMSPGTASGPQATQPATGVTEFGRPGGAGMGMNNQATAEQLRREDARQTGARGARPIRPEDRAHMGGGVVLENGRPVTLGDGMATNAMGGPRGAVQPGTGGPVGTGRNAGVTPGGGS